MLDFEPKLHLPLLAILTAISLFCAWECDNVMSLNSNVNEQVPTLVLIEHGNFVLMSKLLSHNFTKYMS